MSSSRIPSPARSHSSLHTPRRYKIRNVGSPARSNVSRRMSLVEEFKENNKESFVLSPMNSRVSVLSDNTEIEQPKRKSWWKNLGENSERDIMETLNSDNTVEKPTNIVEEIIDMEVLSPENKNYIIDLPESSGSESIDSIVIPQRNLFTQKDTQPQRKFGQIIITRESLTKHQKTITGHDKTINVGLKTLFNRSPKKRTKPAFPAALLNLSMDKSIANKTKKLAIPERKGQVRSLFGNRAGIKRKNMFTDFILSENEDEISDIEPQIFGFQKKTEQKRRVSSISHGIRDASVTSNCTTDTEMDDWNLLPSSTMVGNQLENAVVSNSHVNTKTTSSKLSQAKDDGTNTNATVNKTLQSNKSVSPKNKSRTSSKVTEIELNKSSRNKSKLAKTQEMVIVTEKQSSTVVEQMGETEILKTDEQMSEQVQQEDINNQNVENLEQKSKAEFNEKIQEIEDTEENEINKSNAEKNEIDGNNVKMNTNNEKIELDEEEIQKLEYEEDELEENYSILQNDNSESQVNRTDTIEVEKSDKNINKIPTTIVQEEVKHVELETKEQINQDSTQQSEKEKKKSEQKLSVKEQELQLENINQSIHDSNAEQESNIHEEEEIENSEQAEMKQEQSKQKADKKYETAEEMEQSDQKAYQELETEEEAEELEESKKESDQEQDTEEQPSETEQSDEESDKEIEETDELDQQSGLIEESKEESDQEIEEADRIDQQSDATEESNDSDQKIKKTDEIDEQLVAIEESKEESDQEIEEADEVDQQSDAIEQSEKESDQEVEETEELDPQLDAIEQSREESDQEIEETNEIDQLEESEQNESETDNGMSNVSHKATDQNVNKDETREKSPEVILHDVINQYESFEAQGRNTSIRKTKSLFKSVNIKPSLAIVRESIGMESDGTKNSSAEGSGWDSHRTTRKTLRQTFGKDFTPRKSLRTLVMEKTAKRQTTLNEANMETIRFPQANSTELPEATIPHDVSEIVEESNHEVSKRTCQTTLEMYLQKIKKTNMERRLKIEEAVRNSLKSPPKNEVNIFKVPSKSSFALRRTNIKTQSKPKNKQIKSLLMAIPEEILEDMKYKPPKRFQPSNAPWITKRLYKFLENKLEPKYNYKSRVRAEKLVETIYNFTKDVRRLEVAPREAVDRLKYEMARLNIVKTHFQFYEFFHEFMPREIRVKVNPDIVNKISLPKHGVFADIIQENTVRE